MGKPGTSLVVVGTRGSGKTTALANIASLLGGFEKQAHEEVSSLAKEFGRPDARNAWMLDRLMTERERGLTIEASITGFQSESFSYTAIDTPGDPSLSRNMMGVLSMSDVAALVVSAAAGEYEESSESGRIREAALACFTMGIKNVVVWVTKMDDLSVDFAAARYEEIKKAVSGVIKEVGYKQREVPVVPISGATGDNLVAKSPNMDWYDGKTVVETLDEIGPINRPAEKPLRLPVHKVHAAGESGTVIVGRVEAGTLRVGIKLVFSPGGFTGEVQSIQIDGEKVSEAKGGDIVGVALEGVSAEDLKRGMVASPPTNDPAAAAETFLAQVVVFDHPGTIRPGYSPAIMVHTAQVPCEFEELVSKIDRKTGKEEAGKPDGAKTGEVVTVRMRPCQPVCVETFSAFPSLGRFAIMDHNRIVGVGVIKEVTKRPIPKPRSRGGNEYFES
jgi:elongation factor 1-alpha